MDSKNDLKYLIEKHSKSNITHRLKTRGTVSYLGDFILGGLDGSITTFAVISSVVGASLSPTIAVILGFANIVADGFSMAVSNYLKTKSDQEEVEKAIVMESNEIDLVPEGEKEEIRQIYIKKGFKPGPLLEQVVDVITQNKDQWIETMLVDELGLRINLANPFKAGFITFLAFCVAGIIPLIPFLIFSDKLSSQLFIYSCVITGLIFTFLGLAKGIIMKRSILKSIMETLLIGTTAACLAYVLGDLTKQYFLG